MTITIKPSRFSQERKEVTRSEALEYAAHLCSAQGLPVFPENQNLINSRLSIRIQGVSFSAEEIRAEQMKKELIHIKKTPPSPIAPTIKQENTKSQNKALPFPAYQVNQLAREQLKLKMLADIKMDMQVCMIEGWDALEYPKSLYQELKTLLCLKN